jgi:hypothetical protein
MAISIEIRNPRDSTSTYDQIVLESASAQGGSYSNVTTASVSTSNKTDLSPGYTSYTHTSGDTTKWYRYQFKNASSSIVTPYSREFRGGYSEIDQDFRRAMRDTNSSNYFFTDDDVAGFRRRAVESLWPVTWQEVVDESLSTDGSTEKFTYPSGVTRVADVEFVDSNGRVVYVPSGYRRRGNQLIFDSAPSSGYTIRLQVEKMFTKWVEVPHFFDSYIIDSMRLQAYKEFEADRMQYYKYNSVVNSEGGNIPSIRLVIQNLEMSSQRRLNDLKRTRRAALIG